MDDAGTLSAAFLVSSLVAGVGSVVCAVIALRDHRRGSGVRTGEITWALVPLVLLGALMGFLGSG